MEPTTTLDNFDWDYTVDEDNDDTPALLVVVTDDDGTVVASLGGCECEFEVSDHGNVLVSGVTYAWLRDIARELADELVGT